MNRLTVKVSETVMDRYTDEAGKADSREEGNFRFIARQLVENTHSSLCFSSFLVFQHKKKTDFK